MAKKHTPTWQLRGMAGPPPVVNGYYDHGTVLDLATHVPPGRWEGFRSDLRWALWSYRKFAGQTRRETVKDYRETVTRWRERCSRR